MSAQAQVEMYHEREALRREPLIDEYLKAELVMCRLLRQISLGIMETVDLDLDSMEVKAEVNFYLDGVISYIINDNDIIIRCPKGGLLRNAEALRNAKIQLTWKEPY